MNLLKKCTAEFIGTFVLVFFACGTAAVVGCSAENGTGYLLTALAFGLVIVAMAYSIGNISGCHINPAVSIAMLVSGKLSVKEFIGYLIAQFAGATAGAAALMAYAKMQFSEGEILKALEQALLTYCELDTLAMVFIWEYFYKECNK